MQAGTTDPSGGRVVPDSPVTSDGCPVELYAMLPDFGEADIVDAAASTRPARVLELGCGTGRILHRLAELGHVVTGVDESTAMLSHLGDLEAVPATIESVDLGDRFDVVVLASHLINTARDTQRAAFLAAARRHLAPGGVAVIQWHPPGWFDTAGEYRRERDGVVFHLHGVRRDGPLLTATVDYHTAGRSFTHTFTMRRLSEAELAAALAAAGLRLERWLDDAHAWLAAAVDQPRMRRD